MVHNEVGCLAGNERCDEETSQLHGAGSSNS
jgi:hypothetical protein